MRVLIACEFSGVVRDAFIRQGHDAMSCDLLPTEVPGPHYQGDVFDIIDDNWDLMIAHPPCTYLSKAGARWLHRGGGIDPDRSAKGMLAKSFFLRLLDAEIPRIAVENPTPLRYFGLPQPTQVIQPYEYGEPFSKRTLLWLRGLPPLVPTRILSEYTPFMPSNTSGFARGKGGSRGTAHDASTASRTFRGIAQAMATQWGGKSA